MSVGPSSKILPEDEPVWSKNARTKQSLEEFLQTIADEAPVRLYRKDVAYLLGFNSKDTLAKLNINEVIPKRYLKEDSKRGFYSKFDVIAYLRKLLG